MSGKTNFGDTLTNGIQNVSALLPLLGSEQCERHVGSALGKGFLYAAATPLSIFGSLGVVKTAFATLLATVTTPFCGAQWLDDAGFGTLGSVSSMVTIAKGGAEYGAEVKFVKLLEDQHIDDLDLVEDVEWSGWQTTTGSQSTNVPEDVKQLGLQMIANSLSAWWISVSWNMKLILTSALAALVSICPYLYLISSDWMDPLLWLFPLLRAFGSFLCVVAIQLALQLRIHRIIRGRLLLMKAIKLGLEGDADERPSLEHHLRKLLCKLSIGLQVDPEKAMDPEIDNKKIAKYLSDVLSRDWALMTYQLTMIIGIPMIVVGYVGCFNLVNESRVAGGPYVWLGIEAMFSVLRLALWGWNPKWDEGTSMKIKLKLKDDTPLITTPYPLHNLEHSYPKIWSNQKSSFIICNEHDFLATATRYTGPLQRFASSTVSLFYSLVPDGQSKLLFTTILDLHTRTTRTFYVDSTGDPRVFSSTWKLDARSNAMRVTLDKTERNEPHHDGVFNQVVDHSKHIASRLCGNGRIYALDLQWTVSYSFNKSDLSISEITMNASEETYAQVGDLFMNKLWFCNNRRDWIRSYMDKWKAAWDLNTWTELGQGIEALYILENLVLETYLWYKNRTSARKLAKTGTELADQLFAEWLYEMERRMLEEKEEATKRLDKWKIGDDTKKRLIRMWERASKHLARLKVSAEGIEQRMARIREIPYKEDMRELISTLIGGWYADCWPSDLPSKHLDSQVKWFCRRIQRVLQDGIPQHDVIYSFAHINFAEDPYCYVKDASADVLDAIRLNSSLRVIDLNSRLSTSDVDKILEAVTEKNTLTTLIGPNNLSADILRKNHHILFLPGKTCQQLCTEQHPLCDLVCKNQREWREHAHSACLDMTYAVGFPSLENSCFEGYEVSLSPGAECVIMVYMQSSGQLKLSLRHRCLGADTPLYIFLKSGDITSEWREVHSISMEDIPKCYANKPHEIVIPGELSAGYHEIRIHTKGEYLFYYLHSVILTRYESNTDLAEDI